MGGEAAAHCQQRQLHYTCLQSSITSETVLLADFSIAAQTHSKYVFNSHLSHALVQRRQYITAITCHLCLLDGQCHRPLSVSTAILSIFPLSHISLRRAKVQFSYQVHNHISLSPV